MIIDSKNIEFGNELFAVIPYANYLQSKGRLKATVSAEGTDLFYYFSPEHIINPEPRHWTNIKNVDIPNINVHDFTGEGEWLPPDYKRRYMNSEFVYGREDDNYRPICVVSNKYNREWNRHPVNYIDLNTLSDLFAMLTDYKVFYNRAIPDNLSDDQRRMDLNEYEMIKRLHPEVTCLRDMRGDFNEIQLKIYANCDRFISVQGGNSILASYFGGMNMIFAREGNELRHGFYDKIGKLSGCDVKVTGSYSELLYFVEHWYT